VDKRAGLLLWKVSVNILGKQLCTVDKGWSCSLGIGVGRVSSLRGVCLEFGEDKISHYKKPEYYILLHRPSDLDKNYEDVGWGAQYRKWWQAAVSSVIIFGLCRGQGVS
jgi:hypothetical protein